MLTVTWGTFAGFCVFVAVIGPGFYWIGRLSHRVDSVEHKETVLFKKIEALTTKVDEIHYLVKKNGGGG
jgi:hypothetical protein